LIHRPRDLKGIGSPVTGTHPKWGSAGIDISWNTLTLNEKTAGDAGIFPFANILKVSRCMHDARGKTGMGIKPSYIKRIGQELIEQYTNRFGRDFKENKLGVSENAVIGSKKVRNRVAGYITRKHNTGKKS